ncbi:hypothetical protein KEM56_007377 [Ascosphaera pollenicola]|nr:hypothetical protein KEM56_007377 [Ascosphaera pollenicola]
MSQGYFTYPVRLPITGEFSDLTIKCGSAEFPVHKMMICSASEAFHGALTGPFEEAETGIFKITDFDEKTVERMIQFLYTSDYSVEEPEDDESAEAPDESHGKQVATVKDSLAEFLAAWEEAATVDWTKRAADEAKIRHEAWSVKLMAHARLNALACKYLFTCLMSRTLENIRLLLHEDFNGVHFCEFASYCLEHSGDKDLHELITVIGAEHHDEFAGLPELAQWEFPQEFLVDLLDRSLKVKAAAAAKREAELKAQHEALRAKNATLVSERADLYSRLGTDYYSWRQARALVRALKEEPSWDHTKCEACGEETRYTLEETPTYYYFACRRCGDSHYENWYIDKESPFVDWA